MSVLLKHVQWLLDNQGEKLQKALKRDNVNLTSSQALEIMQEADPSERKLAVQWLFDCFISRGYRWQHIEKGSTSKIHNILLAFGQYRNLLDGPRNLSQYKKLSHIIDVIDPHLKKEKEISGRAIKLREKEICLEESLILHRSETLIVSVPQTERAAKWWGKGTKWCTAAKKSENYFSNYHSQAPLVVFTYPKGLKEKVETKVLCEEEYEDQEEQYLYYNRNQYGEVEYSATRFTNNKRYETVEGWERNKGATRLQLWIGEIEVSLMNEKNEMLSEEFIQNNWQELSSIFEWMLIEFSQAENQWVMETIVDGLTLKNLAEKMSVEQTLNIFKYQPRILNYRSDIVVSDELWIPHALTHPKLLPKNLWNSELAKTAVLANPLAIKFIPLKLITPAFIKSTAALLGEHDQKQLFKGAFERTQNDKIWECIAKLEAKATPLSSTLFGRISELSLESKKWIDRVQDGKTTFEWIPYNERTLELCTYGLKYHNLRLSYIPENLKTYELCMFAIELERGEMYDVPAEHRTLDMFRMHFRMGVRIGENCFKKIPTGEITQELFEISLQEYITKAVVLSNEIDQPEPSILSNIPLYVLTNFEIKPYLIEQIIDVSPDDLQFIGDKNKTADILVSALIKSSSLIKSNKHLLTNDIALRIYQNNYKSIEEIEEIYPNFIKDNWKAIQFKPEYFAKLSDILARENVDKALQVDKVKEKGLR